MYTVYDDHSKCTVYEINWFCCYGNVFGMLSTPFLYFLVVLKDPVKNGVSKFYVSCAEGHVPNNLLTTGGTTAVQEPNNLLTTGGTTVVQEPNNLLTTGGQQPCKNPITS